MEVRAGDIDGGEVVIGNDDAFWIEVVIEFAMDGKTGTRSGSCNQIDNDAMADQRFGALIELDGDEWDAAHKRLEQEWLAAYTAAFR